MALVSKEKANTQKIFAHLCDQMDKLDAKVITTDEAKEQANLAKQANNVLRYELDEAIAKAKFKEDLKLYDVQSRNK